MIRTVFFQLGIIFFASMIFPENGSASQNKKKKFLSEETT